MDLDKQQIIDHLKNRGKQHQAEEAEAQLHETVDTEKDGRFLTQLGVAPWQLPGQVPGARHLKR